MSAAATGGDRPERGERQDRGDRQNFRPDQRRFRDQRPDPAPASDEPPGGLPAFITGARPADEAASVNEGPSAPPEVNEGQGYHLRPRRRRRGRPDNAGQDFAEENFSASESVPASE
jgi:hypothetical protein